MLNLKVKDWRTAWNELKEQGFKNAVLASFHEDYFLGVA
ncbi:MAG: hypothetical protein Ct9H300mP28_23260 [Pseudomonadota bacterium]|nr:MAG: hypothetical protein Ct9H300mP28_23260 [Pseudomonadota bacterium]